MDVRLNGQPVDLASRPAQNLLAYLLLTAGQPHRREQLAALFWPDAPDANARSNLRHALWRLRNAIDTQGEYLQVDTQTVAFNPQSDYSLDTDTLQQELTGNWPTETLIEVVSAYSGDLLPGLYAEWADQERERLRGVFERQMGLLLDRLTADGRWAEAQQWAERWLAVNRASEPAYRALMTAASAQGDMSGLATTYQRCLEALRDELGVAPSAQTRTLYDHLLNGAVPLPVTQPVPPVPVALTPPPPPRPPPPNNQPSPATPFIGREDLLEDIAAHLADSGCRLLTLNGPGGIGKTRLSLQAATAQLEHFEDGVFFVPLAPVGSTDLIIPAIASNLSITLYGGMEAKEQLINYLRDRMMLLVLDNFEHLVEGAEILSELLERAPGVKCLVSSRERLNIQGEWVLSVEGLRVPENGQADDIETYSAVRMFVQSARRAQTGFRLAEADKPYAAHISRLVEGLPLALELAATWVRAISLPEIASEIERNLDFLSTTMRDVPQRHRSLRAVFDHSWNLLLPEERRAFARLSVFRGGFQREAAEAVTGASLPTLSALMDKSLLRRNSAGRYEIHELLRQYARDKLTESREESDIRNHHLAYFLKLADEADPLLRRAEQLEWLARLETEHDNLRLALKWAKADEQIENGLRLAGALTRFWYLHGYWQEARDWLTAFLQMADAMNETTDSFLRAKARALRGAGWLQDENGGEFEFYKQSLALSRQVGDKWGEAIALRGLYANTYLPNTALDRDGAKNGLMESLSIFESLGDIWGVGLVKFNLGWMAYVKDEHTEKDVWWEQAVAAFRQSGDRWGIAVTLGALSYSARYWGDHKRSAEMAKESLQMFREVGDRAGVADALARLASVSYRRSDFKQAIEIYEESLALSRELGSLWDQAQITAVIGMMRAYQGQFERADELLNEGLRLAEAALGPEAAAFIMDSAATAAYVKGDVVRAKGLWLEAETSFRSMGESVALAYALSHLGMITIHEGELDKAETLLREGHDLILAAGEKRGIALALYYLGRLAHARGDRENAPALFRQSLKLRKEMGDKRGVAEAIEGLACEMAALPTETDAVCAVECLSVAEHLREKIGIQIALPDRALRDKTLEGLRVRLGETAFEAARERGRHKLLEEALGELLKESAVQLPPIV